MSIPRNWTSLLDEEDWNFVKRFVLYSGSLKDMANYYNVTYPTLRIRLDKLIKKIEMSENSEDDSFIIMIKNLVIDEKIDYDVAKKIITEYREKENK